LRVLTFSAWYLKEYDSEYQYVLEEEEGVPEQAMNVMALALVYHDIGHWTDGAFDYLEPVSPEQGYGEPTGRRI
jgi:hypothetical protein